MAGLRFPLSAGRKGVGVEAARNAAKVLAIGRGRMIAEGKSRRAILNFGARPKR